MHVLAFLYVEFFTKFLYFILKFLLFFYQCPLWYSTSEVHPYDLSTWDGGGTRDAQQLRTYLFCSQLILAVISGRLFITGCAVTSLQISGRWWYIPIFQYFSTDSSMTGWVVCGNFAVPHHSVSLLPSIPGANNWPKDAASGGPPTLFEGGMPTHSPTMFQRDQVQKRRGLTSDVEGFLTFNLISTKKTHSKFNP